MKRDDYYSQTDAVKRFKISVAKFKKLLDEYQIPQINREVNLGTFSVVTIYVLKSDLDKINLPLRK